MTGVEFTRAVMEHLGCGNGAELASRMGWTPSRARSVDRWLKGEQEPRFKDTIGMLQRCGWLKMTRAPRARSLTEILASIDQDVAEARLTIERPTRKGRRGQQ